MKRANNAMLLNPLTASILSVLFLSAAPVAASVADTTDSQLPTVGQRQTADTTPTISGTAHLEEGDTLTVEVGGVTYIAGYIGLFSDANGTWELSVDPDSPLAPGTYDVTVTVTDAVGNETVDTTSGELTIDPTLPSEPSVVSQTTDNTTPTITGTAELNSSTTLTVELDGTLYSDGEGQLISNPDGSWTLALPSPLGVGVYDVIATVTDARGNAVTDGTVSELTILIDLDDDNDGIPDTPEGTRDTDGDGQPDFQDLDSDNDGIADIVEVQGEDANHDFRIDNFVDLNNNGLSDELEVLPFELVDTDGDLVPDFLDLDSDNDGLSDLLESGGVDQNHDGRIDEFADADGDGADDARQIVGPAGRDSDNDGIPNRLDLDSDNDGLTDAAESGAITDINDGITDPLRDTDGDGIPDSVDVDLTGGADVDGDGIDDEFDASILFGDDADRDGIIDSADPDANGDGFADDPNNVLGSGESLPDQNANGVADMLEGPAGVVRSGLDGYAGCSLVEPTGKRASDPLFAMLGLAALIGCVRRRRVTR